KIGDTVIQIPKHFSDKTQTKYRQQKQKKAFKRRAAIEPVIGHLKSDHRLSRNFYHKIFGDNINVLLSAAAFNFKRMMNKWKENPPPIFVFIFLRWLKNYWQTIKQLKLNLVQISVFKSRLVNILDILVILTPFWFSKYQFFLQISSDD